MELKVLKKEKNNLVFTLDKTNHVVVNTLRRYAMNYVPVLAIEEAEITENSSALFDEVVAHRLGLIPIVTDSKSYNMIADCKCKGKGCAQCQLHLSLKAKGPCTVYSSDIVSQDPKAKPVIEKIPIVKLMKDQEIKMTMIAVLGQGKDHSKFSPCLFYYLGYPELKAGKDANVKECVANSKGVLAQKGNGLEIKDVTTWTEALGETCEKNGVEIEHSDEKFICTLESWGQLDCKEILTEAVKIFDDKLEEFGKLVKKLK
ncbi:MAG: DNA-directed RNA polymerase subunit D [Nanoarchaeota archaeon]